MEKLIETGDWEHSTYEAFVDLNSDFSKRKGVVTGVFCICFDESGNLILANNQPLGGHIEDGESIEDTLKREALEEGGMELNKWKYFGYYKVTQKDSAPETIKEKYPKTAYLLFFLATGKKIATPSGSDVKSSQIISKNEISNFSSSHGMLMQGIKLYPEYLK